jgi:hypothetical protein
MWPMLATMGVKAHLLGQMEAEHSAVADAAAAHASVVRTREVVDRHLDHEEAELEPELMPYVESPEWKAVEKKLRSQSPGVAGRSFAWLTDGMSDEHRRFLHATVPAPVVSVLVRLFGRRYTREVAPVWRAT